MRKVKIGQFNYIISLSLWKNPKYLCYLGNNKKANGQKRLFAYDKGIDYSTYYGSDAHFHEVISTDNPAMEGIPILEEDVYFKQSEIHV